MISFVARFCTASDAYFCSALQAIHRNAVHVRIANLHVFVGGVHDREHRPDVIEELNVRICNTAHTVRVKQASD